MYELNGGDKFLRPSQKSAGFVAKPKKSSKKGFSPKIRPIGSVKNKSAQLEPVKILKKSSTFAGFKPAEDKSSFFLTNQAKKRPRVFNQSSFIQPQQQKNSKKSNNKNFKKQKKIKQSDRWNIVRSLRRMHVRDIPDDVEPIRTPVWLNLCVGFNNTFATVSAKNISKVKKVFSLGMLKLNSSKKTYKYLHKRITTAVINYIRYEKTIRKPIELFVRIKAPVKHFRNLVQYTKKKISQNIINRRNIITSFNFPVLKPFNGCRAVKPRRKKRKGLVVFK